MKEKLFPSQSPCGNPVQIATLLTFNKLIAMGATHQVIDRKFVAESIRHCFCGFCEISFIPFLSDSEKMRKRIEAIGSG